MSDPVPEWINEAVQDARRLFGLGGVDWRFYVRMSDKPRDSAEYGGSIDVDSVYQIANVEFNETITDDQTGKAMVYHEVLHAAHQSIDHLVGYIIADVKSKKLRETYRALYENEIENFVQRIARSVVGNVRKDDISE